MSENEKLTEGKKCLPMCRGCKRIGLKPAKQSNKSRTTKAEQTIKKKDQTHREKETNINQVERNRKESSIEVSNDEGNYFKIRSILVFEDQ